MFDALFQALFSYRPVVFQQGQFRFDVSGASLAAALLVAVIGALAVFTYRRVKVAEAQLRDTIILTGLRLCTLGLLLFCLFRPTLVVRAAVNQRNVVAVVLDDSRSMQIPDVGGRPRADYVREQFSALDSQVLKPLSDRFLVRLFRFSSAARRAESAKELTFDGTQTRIGSSLDSVREELRGLPVAGVVVVSDGADTGEKALSDAILGLKAERLPVFTVGVGSEALPRDIQVDRVSTPRSVLLGASLMLDVTVTQTGYSGQTVTVDVEDDGRIVGSEKVTLPSNGTPASVRVRAEATEAGPRQFKFRVSPLDGEAVTQNNVREALINVRDVRERILYYEGEPRFEMKFLRRAVADDKNLLTVALQRTADNKYMRLDGEPDEVAGGFPRTRDELFRYRGLILGSVEAGAFSGDQLQMIADFVDRRGGGLLMLGGARSFGEGGYGGTPVADALPLLIDPKTRASDPAPLARLKVAPTAAGRSHAVTQIAGGEAASLARWPQLPLVTSINAPLPTKPAATTLLTGTDERGRTHNVLSWQPFGRGKAHRLHRTGLVAVADARLDSARGSDARAVLAAAAAVDRGRRARARGRPDLRARRARRAGRAGRDGRRQVVRGHERRVRRGARGPAQWPDHERAAAVDRRTGRRIQGHVRQRRARRLRSDRGRDARHRYTGHRHLLRAGGGGRDGVLRPHDASRPAAPDCGGHGRAVLHTRYRGPPGRRHPLRRPRRDRARGARPVEHANHSAGAGRTALI